MNQTTAGGRPVTLNGNQQQKAWRFIRDCNGASSRDLSRTAIATGAKTYTYGQMFHQWERYAAVFSALHMTEADRARVGMMGAFAAEAIFAFYGLNMVGAEVSVLSSFSGLKPGRVKQTIRDEKLTDFIITDDFAQPNLIQELLEQKDALGLRNVIVLHVPAYGSGGNMIAAAQETKYMYLKGWYAPICMDLLLAAYGDGPVAYADDAGSETAVILHTSGTTGGVGKPVVLSDQALNAAAVSFAKASFAWIPQDDLVCALSIDLSNAYGLVDQVHLPLAFGGAVAVVPGGALNPTFYKEIPALKITLLFCISAMFNCWMKLPESTKFDFSGLRCVVIGGAAVSAKDKRRFYDFLRANGGGDIPIINGYGISELGGACCLSTAELDDESIGYVLPGVSYRLLDEESGKFLSGRDAPCTGVLYLNSPSVTCGRLDGKELCKTEMIGKKPYVCTNDAVSADAAGKLTFLGRANRYFINDSGVKYESGRVETEFSRQAGIESCCVVPQYVKTRHDNLPMLCVCAPGKDEAPEETVRKALLQVFCTDKTLPAEYVPHLVLIAPELPRNVNGKIDLYGIQQGQVSGDRYEVKAVKRKGCITDFKLIPDAGESDNMIKEVFDGIAADIKDNLSIKNMIAEKEPFINPFASLNAMSQLSGRMMSMVNYANQPMFAQPGTNWFAMPQIRMPGQQQMNQIMTSVNQMSQAAYKAAGQMYSQYYQMMGQLWQQMQNTAKTKQN